MKPSPSIWLIPILSVIWIFFVLGSFFTVQKPFTLADAGLVMSRLSAISLLDWLILATLGGGLWGLGRTAIFRRLLSPVVGWSLFLLGALLVLYKPFSPTNAWAIVNVLLDAATALWLALLALGLGAWLLRFLRADSLSFAERLVLGTSLGLGVLGLLSFGVGLLHGFQRVVAYVITIGLSLAILPQLINLARQWPQQRLAKPPRLITIYLSLFTILTLLIALLPPTDWDGLFYHLTGPKLYIQAGGIVGGIDIPHLSFPSLMEMLFAWAMLLRGDIAAKLLHTLFGFLLAGLVYLLAARFFEERAPSPQPSPTGRGGVGKKSAWLAVLIFTSMPMINILAGWAYNDLTLAFYQLAAIYALINWGLANGKWRKSTDYERWTTNPSPNLPISQSPHFSWLLLSGIFAGLAMGLKYTSFVTPLVIAGLLAWWAVRAEKRRSTELRTTYYALPFMPLLIFACIASLVAFPWYTRNWLFTGNPVYPFLYGLFGGQYWDEFRAAWYASARTGIGWQPLTLLALPWLLTLGVRDANYWDGRTGPLLLLFLPLILLVPFLYYFKRFRNLQSPISNLQPPAATPLLIYALAHFAVWTLGVIWSRSLWQSRLLLPGLVALAPLAGWIWSDLPRLDLLRFSLSRFVNLVIALTLALTLIDLSLLTLKIDPLPYLVGQESRDDYLARRLGVYYLAMQRLDDSLPAEAQVLFLWEPRSYYCRSVCHPDSILDEFPAMVHRYNSAEAIAQAWRDEGVTYILLHRAGLQFVLNEMPAAIDRNVLETLENQYWQQVFNLGDVYQLYRLKEANE